MKLKILHESKKYKVASVMEGDECETETFLNHISSNYQANAFGLYRLIEQITESGLDVLSTSQFHLVDKENKIYELIKGDIRLLCFKWHANLLIVTTHAFIKKSQKTPQNEKDKAIRYKKKYQQAHDQNQIGLVRD